MSLTDLTAEDVVPYSPEWWRDLLCARLDQRLDYIRLCEDYYDGRHRLDLGTPLWHDTFRYMFQTFADNWMALIVDSAVERLRVQGFRFGEQDADDEAWAIWQTNELDLGSRIAHTEAVKCGESFLLVAPPRAPGEVARITIEHPAQCIIARDPADERVRLAGLKRWTDDAGRWYATVYLPDTIWRWQSEDVDETTETWGLTATVPGGWVPRDDADGPVLDNPLGRVPLIALANNPQLQGGGRSDIVGAIPLQDAIDKVILDALIASEYAALRQRWATGLEVPKDADGNPLARAQLDATFSRLWIAENPDAKWGEFSVADLTGHVAFAATLTQHLAAQSRTPPHYLLGQVVNASGDALKTAEATLVAKVRAKMVDFAEPWEEAIRCAFLLQGDTERGNATDAETIWADPESRTESEHADAVAKQAAIGVPPEMLWEQLGYSPQQIERMRDMQPAPPPAQPPPSQPPPEAPPEEGPE